MADLTAFTRRDRIVEGIALPKKLSPDQDCWLVLVTQQGVVKKLSAQLLTAATVDDITVLTLAKGDLLASVQVLRGDQDLVVFTRRGKALRFDGEEVRASGLSAKGMRGIRLGKGDTVVATASAAADGTVLTVTEHGQAKRTELAEFQVPETGRDRVDLPQVG